MRRTYAGLVEEADDRMKQRHVRLAIELALEESGFTAVERTDIHFDDPNFDQVVLGLPGYPEHGMFMRIDNDEIHCVPFRTDDRSDVPATVSDREFDDAACAGVRRALACLGRQHGGALSFKVEQHSDVNVHPVQPASAMREIGVRVDAHEPTKQRPLQAQCNLDQ